MFFFVTSVFLPLPAAPVLSTRSWTVPTLHDGRLYVRDLEKIARLDLRL